MFSLLIFFKLQKSFKVSNDLRQKAKQICYGIIYGIGTKSLSEQLEVTEQETMEFVEKFHNKYKCIKQFIQNTIQQCREKGFVETLSGRRRYLPHILDSNPAIKSNYKVLLMYIFSNLLFTCFIKI